jgi:hypothetical protein
MEINYNLITIKRLIVHTIIAKESYQKHAEVVVRDEIYKLQPKVEAMIKKRLCTSAGKYSKSFELEISDTSHDSFFNTCKDMKNFNELNFIEVSKKLAESLAKCQKNSKQVGGFFILMECNYENANSEECGLYIVIKAEPQEALTLGDKNQLELLENIFLSSDQRLYKIGTLYEKNSDSTKTDLKENYGCFVFDDQTTNKPADYFYNKFLGYSKDSNSKIRTEEFYSQTSEFIRKNAVLADKYDLLSAVRTEMRKNSDIINPDQFAVDNFPEDLRLKYREEIISDFPNTFTKDTVLVNARLKKRSIDFDEIRIIGPDDIFNSKVEIIESLESLRELNPTSKNYSIIKIEGKPFQNIK